MDGKVGKVGENVSGNLNWNRSKFPNTVPLEEALGDENYKTQIMSQKCIPIKGQYYLETTPDGLC